MRLKIRPVCLCRDCENRVSRPGYLYCSNRCQQEHQHHEYVKAWLAGEKDGARGVVEVSYHVKRWLKDTYGEKCCQCGWAERNLNTGLIPLHLDHIDGNWRNNRPENLRLLCPNCHALTATYGAQNRGNGRPFIVQKKAVAGDLGAA
ncbi:HNH endonuclease [Armatimonas rosea]|uniref:HNH endonuclease n=1 Tax=Armatimonas rosea TaxID=685828 RepID=UPI00161B9648